MTDTYIYVHSKLGPTRLVRHSFLYQVIGAERGTQDTAQIIKHAFPELSDYPLERIEILSRYSGAMSGWARVTDESWEEEVRKKPEKLRVQLLDMPGDLEERELSPGMLIACDLQSSGEAHERRRLIHLGLYAFVLPVVLFVLIVMAVHSIGSAKKEVPRGV
jgi:hypothetical protein